MNGLTPKQAEFVRQYMLDLNASQAAIRAGYSKNRANQTGYKLLTNGDIQQALTLAIRERVRRTEIKADAVLEELRRVAFSSMAEFATWGPAGVKLIDSEKLTDEQGAMVAEISQTVTKHGGSKRIKLHDKLKALELLGRHLHLWDRETGTEEKPDWREMLAALRAHGRDIKNPNLNIDLSEFEGRN